MPAEFANYYRNRLAEERETERLLLDQRTGEGHLNLMTLLVDAQNPGNNVGDSSRECIYHAISRYKDSSKL